MAQPKDHDEAVSYKMIDSSKIAAEEIEILRNQIWQMRHPTDAQREQLWASNVVPREQDLKGMATQRIYEWESDTTWFRAYEIQVNKFVGFQYTLDFSGTTNHEIQGTFGVMNLKVEANLQPFELETVCLLSRNKLDPFKMSVKMQWVTTDVHPAIVETALNMNSQKIVGEYQLMKQCGVDARTQELDEIRSKLRSAGAKFVDEDFYPHARALYVEEERSKKVEEEQVMWRRAGDYCADPCVFKDGIDPSDVQQGRLGNCWFCCALASMAERPELIERLFITKEANHEGLYEVRFCHNGLWKVVLLDDYIPCKPYTGAIYTKTADDELWVALLEKAYAKVFGCYERLISGSPYHALPDLTGCPAEVYELQDPEHIEGLWKKLIDWNISEDQMMTAACSESSRANPVDAGLLLDHSYTILDGKEGHGIKLLCLRNPWGHGEWKGDWSDFSPLWSEKTKAYFKPTFDPDDGTFWMSYEDFLKYFTSLIVCYCRRDWTEARSPIQLKFDPQKEELTSTALRVVVPQNSIFEWVSIYQQDEREHGAPPYLDLSVLIFKETDTGRKPVGFLGTESSRQAFVSFGSVSRVNTQVLSGGNYILVPFTSCRSWNVDYGLTREITIAVHVHSTVNKVSMKPVGECGKQEIDQALYEFAMEMGEEKTWHDLERRHLRVGQMDIYAGKNKCNDKILIFSMSGDLDNIINAVGYPDLAKGGEFELGPDQGMIFGVQVMKNPKDAGASAYKFGLKSKPA